MKKSTILTTTLVLLMIILSPITTNAKELICSYDLNGNNIEYKLENNTLKSNINDKNLYEGAYFKERFIESSNNGTVCPNIYVEENDMFTTLFVNNKEDNNCNGTCKNIYSTNNKINIVETKSIKAIGIYNSDKYVIPVFRKLSDNTIEVTINNSKFYDVEKNIKLDNNSYIEFDTNLVKKMFTNDLKEDKIYRCISRVGSKYEYLLTYDKAICKNDLSKNDGQGYSSLSYNGTKGVNCNDAALGSKDDPNSVAWLINKILSYLRVLGPMIVIVMGAFDFSKAVLMGDDETLQKAYKKLTSRLILIVVLFFIPTLVELLLEIFGLSSGVLCGL